ncbi:pyridoxal phosphate-dependent class II aminotransferase [Thermosulfuriphilus ammonigenes]|uniref:Aminotransferase n=1 Tax=Thermosulfuriphilus ammonigenes TaxID=1936021 RepID=A0A6G7PTJ2_9BACT|nr:threonine-phosphate decarboxylase [Thermosulfuriphilus ammonigenes]MBA2848912.1 threonine-phosphate decarboxylase [Thermosulfuriphilus ammonigenes]QIJ70972.1 pyridoxal phosphate-dependent class II aminotransferase [Thermosulfuriphilus ammonigenes]
MLKGHGGNIYQAAREAGVSPEDLVDLSGNINPLGPPEELFAYLKDRLSLITRLPEPDLTSLRQAVARRLEISPDMVFPAPGTTDWIYLLPAILRAEEVIIFGPTYADYADAATIWGKKAFYLLPDSPRNWPNLNLPPKGGPRVYFLCNPNNPTGGLLSRDKVLDLAQRLTGDILVIDESYLPFAASDEASLAWGGLPGNVLVLRSFSKIYAIPGLRLGCLLAPESLFPLVAPHLRPWWVGTLAAEAGVFLLNQRGFEEQTRNYLKAERERIYQRLKGLPGLEFFTSVTTFILCRLKAPRASELCRRLLKRGFLLRPCGNFVGLDDHYFRFSLKDPETNNRFLQVLTQELVDMA